MPLESSLKIFWMVVRTDDPGNTFLVKDGLTKEGADEIVANFMRKKVHKQYYTIYSYTKASRAELLSRHRIFV